VHGPQGEGQRVLALGHGDQMHVVGHQAIGPQGNPMQQGIFTQQAQVGLVVLLGMEHGHPAVSPLDDMVRFSRNHGARQSTHDRTLGRIECGSQF
jgi:hypothetical protein